MKVRYLFSSPGEDIPVGPDELAMPFKITPSEDHPFLTIGDYFEAIETFVLKDNLLTFVSLIGESVNKPIGVGDIREVLIRAEKNGAFYHVASVEVVSQYRRVRVSVSTAVSERGKSCLNHEFNMLVLLDKGLGLPFIPRPFFRGDVKGRGDLPEGPFSMFLTEWFQGFHEWHLSPDEGGSQRIRIWDMENGHRFAAKPESREIIRQASRILTLFYDTQTFEQVWPWHHAAGDFVVRVKDGITDVRLTTARRYEPVMSFLSEEEVNPVASLVYFFLNLTVKMRLDKLDGTGDVAWGGDFFVEEAVRGFFDALRIMEAGGRYHLGKVGDLLGLFKAFSLEELERLFHSLSGLYEMGDAEDLTMIQASLKGHVQVLFRSLQAFSL